MKPFDARLLQTLTIPAPGTHKGQNGRLCVIGGSHLFHAASLWALEVASRIVDLVHYASVPENNAIVAKRKEEFRNGIVISRSDLAAYIEEDDCILIGPGMTRDEETRTLTHTLLSRYPDKQWVIDAGSLQMLALADIPQHAILTPHQGEFAMLWERAVAMRPEFVQAASVSDRIRLFAKTFNCIVLLKGNTDIVCAGADCAGNVCTPGECVEIRGGNEGMTKGGTGDVLAGLIAAFACTNDPYVAAASGSYINKQAGDDLYASAGPFFNASDLAVQIPKTMRRLLFEPLEKRG